VNPKQSRTATDPPRPPGRPPRISRDIVVRAAQRIVDTEGLEGLTMRRLAREVGTTPMALYHHVGDKEALLLLLLDDFAASMRRPRLPADPRRRIVAIFRTLHEGFMVRPWLVEVTTDHLMSEAALWYLERVVDAAVEAGLSRRDAVRAFRTLWYYTAGEIILSSARARRRAAAPGPVQRDDVFSHIDGERYPQLAAIGGDWVKLSEGDTYRFGLEALVAGLLPATDPLNPSGS
jgi:AcrR family transcriptional regulator